MMSSRCEPNEDFNGVFTLQIWDSTWECSYNGQLAATHLAQRLSRNALSDLTYSNVSENLLCSNDFTDRIEMPSFILEHRYAPIPVPDPR
jgi:hypothetical protein